ncbi:MAG: FAD-dependent oxidoreductase [Ilumatobacteraceae bacterium]|nr:FAD-dependent oxidoreductase [Ilumatobacteraceae bacterium]
MTVAVVGAGLAGLACAVELERSGIDTAVYEASDGVGGRVRSDRVDGFIIDRGFQVALLAYPELHRGFDLAALDFQPFDPGALVWRDGRGAVVADPFRQPRTVVSTATAPIGSLFDKARIAQLRHRLRSVHPSRLLTSEDRSTRDALAAAGFSDTIIDRFFTPLVGGIQLDPELSDSRRMFDVIFRMLADGDSAVPATGMQAIPEQLAARLPEGSIMLDSPVERVRRDSIAVHAGSTIAADAVVVATEGPVAARLLDLDPVESKSVGSVAFRADMPPIDERLVVLDGTGRGPVLNVAVMSNVASTYAPAGSHEIVAAAPGHTGPDLVDDVRRQLRDWWGPAVDRWEVLATHRISHGQPRQRPPFDPKRRVSLDTGVFVCGDHRDTASIQGALFSGRRCAKSVIAALDAQD